MSALAGWVAFAAFLGFAVMAWRMNRLHRELASSYRAIAGMLENPERAGPIAREHADQWGVGK